MKTGIFLTVLLGLAQATYDPDTPPKNWGVVLFNSFDTIDVFGVLDPLFYLAFATQINLSLLAETLDPVWIRPFSEAVNVHNSTFRYSINPTHTFATAPENIEVLLVPGGPALLFNNELPSVDFVRKVYPNLRYLITTCTGAGIAAQAGVLDGKRATTNKKAWARITSLGPNVNWVSPARWVVDGNVWTASGVTAGIDLIFAFIEEVYKPEFAKEIQGTVEHVRAADACDDPFSEWHKVPPSGQCKA